MCFILVTIQIDILVIFNWVLCFVGLMKLLFLLFVPNRLGNIFQHILVGAAIPCRFPGSAEQAVGIGNQTIS